MRAAKSSQTGRLGRVRLAGPGRIVAVQAEEARATWVFQGGITVGAPQ